MRFEVRSAIAIGLLLPILETARRGLGHWAIEFTTMFEDYLAGALLLAAAFAAIRGRAHADPLLLLAWTAVTSMMSISFFWQVEETVRAVDVETHNVIVLAVKFMLWSVCVASTAMSYRRVTRTHVRPPTNDAW